MRQDECTSCSGSGCGMCKRVVTLSDWTKTEITDKVSVVSGSVVSDTSGKFQPGWHCRSSLIVGSSTDDCGNVTFETKNSYYSVVGKGDSDPVANLLGKGILNAFY